MFHKNGTPSSHLTSRQFKRLVLLFVILIVTLMLLAISFSLTQPITAAPIASGEVGGKTAVLTNTAAIHGLKWHDLNGDGIFDANESTLPGWHILIEGPGIFSDTVTNAQGHYSFEHLPDGVYDVWEEQQEGWHQTFPSGDFHTVELDPGQIVDGVNFGNVEDTPGQIHGIKWNDLDGDGIFDDNETGLPNWHILIEGSEFFSHTVTDAQGHYWFMDLPSGLYEVWEEQQEGWQQTFPESHHVVELEPGDVVDDIHFGNWQPDPGEIHGMKWHDVNGNGLKDSNELGLDGWVIKLVLDGHGVISETVTDSGGNYWFMNILPGEYFIIEMMQDGWQQTFPEEEYHYVVLEAGQVVDHLDFGNWEPIPGSIHGMKWHDLNGNGQKESNEPGLEGWGIIIEGEGIIHDTTTDSNGEYWFMELLPGSYTLTEVQRPGWQQTHPPDGSHEVELAAGEMITGVDFGNWEPPLSSLHGTKFLDLNGNGLQDTGEPGLPGWTILLQNDQGQVLSAETDSDGRYWFMDIFPDTYHIAELHHPWSDWTQTTPTGTHTVELPPGTELHNLDFGNWEQGKEDFCVMPWDNHFLNEDYLDTQVYVFNTSDTPEKGYVVHMIGLPAGTILADDVDGSTTFDILTPLPITLNPSEYGTVDVRVHYPPAFAAGAEHRAVIQAVVTNLETGESFGCHAALWPELDWWTEPVVNMGIGQIPFGFTLAAGFTVTNNTPFVHPGWQRALQAEGTVSYTVVAMTPGHETNPIISLNGLPAGEPIMGEVTLGRWESAVIPVSIQFTEHVTDTVSDILLELDIDQDGEPDAVTSIVVQSVNPRLYLPFITR